MSHFKRGACALLAIIATASMQLASADIIDSQHPYLTANGSTHTLIVSGGEVAFTDGYDTSSIDITGGHASHMFLNDSALVRLTSGDISHLTLNDSTVATVEGGQVGHLTSNTAARVTVAGGVISWLNVYGNSTAAILGAPTFSWLVVDQTAHVDVYVTDAVYSNGRLSGTWLDGTPFDFGVMIGSGGMPGTSPAELPPNITIHSPAPIPSAH
jgi:hypothetical protein